MPTLQLDISPEKFASNVDTELNKRGLSLAGDDHEKLVGLRRGIKGEKGKEVCETGEVRFKREFKLFPKLPLELRRLVWKRAIPIFPHRVITVETDRDDPPKRIGNSPTITYPRHPALDLMVTCKEFKKVLCEECFAHLKTPTRNNTITENNETPEVVNFKKEAIPSLASQRVNFNDDIFYLTNGLDYLEILERKSPIPIASIKRVLIPREIFDDIIYDDMEPYDVMLQTLTGLEQIIILDFPQHTFPSHYMDCVRKPSRGYTEEQFNAWPWLSLEPPTSIEPYYIMEYDDRYTSRFHDWVKGQLRMGGNGPDGEREFDKEKFKKFIDVKVYYADASKCRVGPELVVQDEDRYEFSLWDRRWYSTSTGLAAVTQLDED
ncbi:hypothetical protein DL98DRAFT_630954 [Cadophora sp. DSE1049]|nr:hypothetical protein DL98DRAFT_630954 [Cadophora sp. DSE1049]